MKNLIVFFILAAFSSLAHASERVVFRSYDQAKGYVEKHQFDKMSDGFLPPLTLCASEDCTLAAAQTLAETKRAYEGNYQGQRNLAYCLWSGCGGAVSENKQLSCAWRMVILASGSPKMHDGDIGNFKLCLDKLSTIEKAAMKSQAASLYRTVYGREIPREWQ